MKKLPKDIQELLDNTPKMSEKSLKQLKKAAEELKNDSEFQKEVEEGIRENVEISKKLEEIRIKKEIENIAIPWSKFRVDGCHYRNILNVHLLKPLFIDLLGLVKERTIIVRCGVGMMQIINENFNIINREGRYSFAGCEIIAELDFNLAKFDMVYDDICIVGKGVPEIETPDNGSEYFHQALKEVAEKVCPPKKNIWQRIFG